MSKSSENNLKYALYSYDNSTNIGDEIQSIAARRFLPRIDYFINRDEVGSWRLPQKSSKVKLITNAWYMSKPYHWPIGESNLDPLLISMHIETEIPETRAAFSSAESVGYLKKHQPIGCRDVSTQEFLQELGLETYFSGCLTLTLQKDPNIKKEGYVLASGVTDAVYKKLQEQTDRTVIRIDSHSEDDESFLVAEKYLYLYQAAHCVVTSRLHAMLPSLALETPVLFISDGNMTASHSRFNGLQELTHNLSENEYTSNPSLYSVAKPPKNPEGYKKIRADLIEKCRDFTGYDNTTSFARSVDFKKFNLIDCLDLILYNQDYIHERTLREKDAHLEGISPENQQLINSTPSVKHASMQLLRSLRRYSSRHLFHR